MPSVENSQRNQQGARASGCKGSIESDRIDRDDFRRRDHSGGGQQTERNRHPGENEKNERRSSGAWVGERLHPHRSLRDQRSLGHPMIENRNGTEKRSQNMRRIAS